MSAANPGSPPTIPARRRRGDHGMQLRPPRAGAVRAMFDRRPRRRAVAVGAAATASAVCLSLLGVAPAQAADVTHTIAQVQGTPRRPTQLSTRGPDGHGRGHRHRRPPLAGSPHRELPRALRPDRRVRGVDRRHSRRVGRHLRVPREQPGYRRGHRRQGQASPAGSASSTPSPRSPPPPPASVELVQAGVGVPAVTPLADTVLGSAREAFEGMLVRPTGTYKLVSSHNLQSFGELWTSAGSRDAGGGVRDAGAGDYGRQRHHHSQ